MVERAILAALVAGVLLTPAVVRATSDGAPSPTVADATETPIAMPTQTVTDIETCTMTEVPTLTATEALPATATSIPTATDSIPTTPTDASTPVASVTPTDTPNSTPTATAMSSPTDTETTTPSWTPTPTPEMSSTPMPTRTGSLTPTSTLVAGCAATPLAGCRTPGRSSLERKHQRASVADQFTWSWLKGSSTSAEFGDPVHGTSTYRVCLYDGATDLPTLQLEASAQAGGTCAGKPCWKQIGSATPRGFRYWDPNLASNGLASVLLRAGNPGHAKIIVRTKGASYSPTIPLNQGTTMTVQLVRADGDLCWQGVYPAAPTPNTRTATAAPTDPLTTTNTPMRSSPPTETPTVTPIPPPLVTPLCYAGAGGTDSGTQDYTGSPSDKIGAQVGRWLRDWATWIPKHAPPNGYGVDTPVQPLLDFGPSGNPQTAYGPWYPNQLVCAGDPDCSVDLMSDTSHCEEKVSYENQCRLQDWDTLWKWIGDPTMPEYGHCRDDASTDLHAACQSDSDCIGYGPCIKKCDVFKFGNDPGATPADPAPPGSISPTGVKAGRTAWEVCRCYAEYFTKPQMEEWLTDAQGLKNCADGGTPGAAMRGR